MQPEVNAGNDTTICMTDTYTTNGLVNNGNGVQYWETSGDGTFANYTDLETEYTPGGMDILNGSVTLTLYAGSIGPCVDTVSDFMVLTIQALPIVDAGDDANICEDQQFTTNPTITTTNSYTVFWTHDGDGNFNDPTLENATYLPGIGDAGTCITLTLTVTSEDPCETPVLDNLQLCMQALPTVDAGNDATTGTTTTYSLEGMAQNTSSILWTVEPGYGSFDNETELSTTFTPVGGFTGPIMLYLTGYPTGPCQTAITDSVELTVIDGPTADAGVDQTICELDPAVLLNGVCTNGISSLWTTSGDGTFNDPSSCQTSYLPGVDDISNASVILTLEVLPFSPGQESAFDAVTITFSPAPEAYAGNDATICGNETYLLDGASALNYSSISWTTSGDGSFSDVNSVNPVYTPGMADIENGSAQLCIHAHAIYPCSDETMNCLNLVLDGPTIGLADTLKLGCDDYDFTNNSWLEVHLNVSIENGVLLQWETSGDGTFDDPTILNPVYTFGDNDQHQGIIELCVSVEGNGCQLVFEKCIQVLVPQQIINFHNNDWHGLSSYLNPYNTSIVDVMHPIVQYPGSKHLIIMINKSGNNYTPDQISPTSIKNWDPVGYKAKIKNVGGNSIACLPIYGEYIEDRSFEVNGNFTYLPVLTNVKVDIENLFGENLSDIYFLLNFSNKNFWTPPAGDFDSLSPGNMYLFYRKNPLASYTLNFPDYDPNAPIINDLGVGFKDFSSPWESVEQNSVNHYFLFSKQATSMLETGDVLGVFNQAGQCMGNAGYAGEGDCFCLVAAGDETFTSEIDGLAYGEQMSYQLYRTHTGETFEIDFTYDPEYPNADGLYMANGFSMVNSINMGISGIYTNTTQANVKIFPNPALHSVHVEAGFEMATLTFINHTGQVVLNLEVNQANLDINISNLSPGVYTVRIISATGNLVNKRLIIQK
jgi:hypothetical protein